MTTTGKLVVFVACVVGAGQVAAYTLEEQKQIKTNQDNLAEAVTKMNRDCGAKITAEYDLKSEPKPEANHTIGTGYNLCASVTEGVAWACRHDDAKPTIVKKLKAVKCTYKDGSSPGTGDKHVAGKPDLVLKLQGTTLTATFDWGSSNISDTTGDWVMKNL